jgi:predicted RecA/RadA family phage recombinase
MKNHVQEGRYIEAPLPYARKSGEGVLIGALFGVCVVDGASGDLVNIDTKTVYDLTGATGAGTDASFGAAAYWDDTAKKVTPVATNNTMIGVFVTDKATTDAVARVRIG